MADQSDPRGQGEVFSMVGTHMYYRMPDGEVVAAMAGGRKAENFDRMKYLSQGWEPLDAYGRFSLMPYHASNPYEVLFQRGGAKELSLAQIIDTGLHLNPPLVPCCKVTVGETGHLGNPKANTHTRSCWQGARPVEFTHIDASQLPEPEPCAYAACGRVFPTKPKRLQHECVAHKDEMASQRMGLAVADGIRGIVAPGTVAEPAPPSAAPAFTPAATPYVCGLCGEALPNAFALNKHIGDHKKALVAA